MTDKESKKNEFLEARSILLDEIKREFVGAETEDILIENPVRRYAAGMLFPDGYEKRSSTAVEKDMDPDKDRDEIGAENEEEDDINEQLGAPLSGSFFPSAMGISFYCKGRNPALKARVSWATFRELDPGENFVELESIPEQIAASEVFQKNFVFQDGKLGVTEDFDKSSIKELGIEDNELKDAFYRLNSQTEEGWKRINQTVEVEIGNNASLHKLDEGLELHIQRRRSSDGETTLFTIAANNTKEAKAGKSGMGEESVFFDFSISVLSNSDKKDIFSEYDIRPSRTMDDEEKSLALLYRKKKTYAVGHGCAANWKKDSTGAAIEVHSETIPYFEVAQADFEVEGIEDRMLQMASLSGEDGTTDKEIFSLVTAFAKLYQDWIKKLEARKDFPAELKESAAKHIRLCQEASSRMLAGIEALQKDPLAIRAFKLANRAMMVQSFQSNMQKIKRTHGEKEITWPDYKDGSKKWRPFQLAFLLMSIRGIMDETSDDRQVVDLIWFPTGGGKTEAYLGLSAFTILFRRLKFGARGGGTSIIMRYTLRLLTAQQFQRACTLICALELMREKEGLGDEEISIGLWVGSESTANTVQEARERFREFLDSGYGNPSPILSCPWCGTRLSKEEEDGRRRYAQKDKRGRTNIYCFEEACPFHERLPILFVDEEIYDCPPTLLFGTVDKFAQMPREKGVSRIFATEPENPNRPPELIIQDELHLIAGALGTIVGLYETAIDYLCASKGTRAKIVASTATVRRAAEQCNNLFDREVRQFPPPGIDLEDSFFSKEAPLEKRPGRLYAGIMPSGKTQTTAAVRLSALLARAVAKLPVSDSVKDKYWTMVSYFNSIRELGGFISLSQDDIPMYANVLKQRYGGAMRHIRVQELTSRKKAEDIPYTLELLEAAYPNPKAIDILAATNMISVGVDIDRLGLMVVRGQPKLTSEYIQVSSRIGRKYPGLVAVLYNSARTRDRAHYERFITYHESFYRYVEPSSVTPFSAPARMRALKAVAITMARHGGAPELLGDKGAANFSNELEILGKIRAWVEKRVRDIDPKEADSTIQELESFYREWEDFARANEGKAVYKNAKAGSPLIGSPMQNGGGRWPLPTSMRNVDAECNINIIEDA